MPSFLSKVFGRKKDGKGSPPSRGRGSDGSLLDGKFEAVSPTVSPSAAEFPENAVKANEKEKDGAFGLFKAKSRPSRPSSPEPSKKENLPQLSLVLPVPKEDAQAHALGVVFEADPDAQILNDETIGKRRLTPLEALVLVRTCSQAIIARGLETLGLMHPHWYSASPEVQRRLISLFIRSLNPNNAINTLSPTSSSPISLFESEINYTRSPHDVAAVLRWGLRHLELDGKKFGKEDSWYRNFASAERSSDYPPKAYSEKLSTLDLFSSLAAHAEKNTQHVGENDDWPKFYARWKDSGRILEHLFLARIRDESLRLRMPTRLTELVTPYPYMKGATSDNDVFLQPHVSTRQYDALLVRIETEFSSSQEKVHRHPLQFLKDAFAADVATQESDFSTIWEKLRRLGGDENEVSPGGYPGLSSVFADETIRYLTLIPGDHPLKKATSPTFSITEISQETTICHRYASSPLSADGHSKSANGTTNGHVKPAPEPSPLPSALNTSLSTDWVSFSSAGFTDVSSPTLLASTLFGQDVEKTNPPYRKPSRRSRMSSPSRSPSATLKSVDATAPPRTSNVSQRELPKLTSKAFPASIVQIDEAFIEFWIDALLDPISSSWPKCATTYKYTRSFQNLFVLCKLRSSLTDLTVDGKRIQYLVVEHVFVPKPPSPTPAPAELPQQPVEATTATNPQRSVPSSRSSIKSEKRLFGFFTSSGRHSFYASSSTTKGKKASPQTRVSELGEVVENKEEKPNTSSTVKLRIPSPKPRKSVDARKSTEVPKSVAEKAVEKEKEVSSGGGATTAAVVWAVAEENKQDTSPPVEDTHKPVEENLKVADDATKPVEETQPAVSQTQETVVEDKATPVAVTEAPKLEKQPAPVSEVTAEVPATNGHTLAVITEKSEDTAPAISSPSVDPVSGTKEPQEPAPGPTTVPITDTTPELAAEVAQATEQFEPLAAEAAVTTVKTEEPIPVVSDEPAHTPVADVHVLAVAAAPEPEPEPSTAVVAEPEAKKVEEVVVSGKPLVIEGPAVEPEPVVEAPVEKPVVEEVPIVKEEEVVSKHDDAHAQIEEPPTVEPVIVAEEPKKEVVDPAPQQEAPVAVVKEPVVEEVSVVEEPAAREAPVVGEPVVAAAAREEPVVEAAPTVVEEPVGAAPTEGPKTVQESAPVVEEPAHEIAVAQEMVNDAVAEEPYSEGIAEPVKQETLAQEPVSHVPEEAINVNQPLVSEESLVAAVKSGGDAQNVVIEEENVSQAAEEPAAPVEEPAPTASETPAAEQPILAEDAQDAQTVVETSNIHRGEGSAEPAEVAAQPVVGSEAEVPVSEVETIVTSTKLDPAVESATLIDDTPASGLVDIDEIEAPKPETVAANGNGHRAVEPEKEADHEVIPTEVPINNAKHDTDTIPTQKAPKPETVAANGNGHQAVEPEKEAHHEVIPTEVPVNNAKHDTDTIPTQSEY
ncbi:hypothetical protein AN958_10694 [Leucoagaricus sp. SymC.cos]|nr:hypothetical protein AN958_10694 [Leucoagaricus sp. SymC.cos]